MEEIDGYAERLAENRIISVNRWNWRNRRISYTFYINIHKMNWHYFRFSENSETIQTGYFLTTNDNNVMYMFILPLNWLVNLMLFKNSLQWQVSKRKCSIYCNYFHLIEREWVCFAFLNFKYWVILIVWFSRYLKELLQTQSEYYKLQTQHNRLKQIISSKNEKIICLRREKSTIWKKYNQLLRAYKSINATKISVHITQIKLVYQSMLF